MRSIGYCCRYVWKTSPKYIVLLVLVSVLTAAFNVINLLILRLITESLAANNTYSFCIALLILVMVSILIAAINGSVNYLIEPVLKNKVIEHIQGDIFLKAQSFNLEEFENKDFYDLYYFVTEHGTEGIINTVSLICGLLANSISIMGLGSIILQYNNEVVIVAFIGATLSCALTMKLRRIQYDMKVDLVSDKRGVEYINRIFYLPEFIKEVLIFGKSKLFWGKYSSSWRNLNTKTERWGKICRKKYLNISIVDLCVEISILAYLGIKTILGMLRLEDFVVLYTGLQQIITQSKAAISCIPEIYSNNLDLNKYFEFMSAGKKPKNENNIKKIIHVAFKNVSYSYKNGNKALNKINVEIGGKNKRVAIVGQNGSGKTTFIKLLLGFYEQYDGEILVNDTNFRNINKEEYRERISVMFQDFKVFSASFDQNIAMAYDVTQKSEDIQYLLNKFDASSWVAELPYGRDTVLSREFDKNGINLSGGERQKVAVLRTLYKTSDLIVLDEPLSEIDNLAANAFIERIIQEFSDKIIILVTHKLVHTTSMDYIYVMSDGELIEQGTKDELLEAEEGLDAK